MNEAPEPRQVFKLVHPRLPGIRGRGVYLLPNLLTTSALLAGFYAIIEALHASYQQAAVAIFVAMVLDGLDGRIARLTNTQSAFGAEYDSLADMVSFGVAPAILAHEWLLHETGRFGFLAAFFYVSAAALRLARFNSQAASSDRKYFKGLPSPASAAVVAGFIWCFEAHGLDASGLLVALTFVVTLACGALMVSNIRFYSFKELDLRGRIPFVRVLLMAAGLGAIAINPPAVLLAGFVVYASSGPLFTLYQLRRRRAGRSRVQ